MYLISNFFNPQLQDDMLLEPLSIIIKLSILSFKPVGTKLSIQNNTLIIDESNFAQGIKRIMKRSRREDISLLFKPIKRALIIYPPEDDKLIYIYGRVLLGLQNLKKSYVEPSTLHLSIDLYINIISTTLENKKIPEQYNTFVSEKLKDIWEPSDMNLIYELLHACETHDNNLNYMESIENILNTKRELIDEKIDEIT